MAPSYVLTQSQSKILQALGDKGELSQPELAVYGLMLPRQVATALEALERMALVSSSRFAGTGERLTRLTAEGRSVARSLAPYGGDPPAGTLVPLPSGSIFTRWLNPSQIPSSGGHVLVTADSEEPSASKAL